MRPEEAWGITPIDRIACARKIAALRSDGVFTPPSLEGSVIFPGSAGGSNWGSVAYDPKRRLLFANTSRIANTVQLIPRDEADFDSDRGRYVARFEQAGTPYVARFDVLVSPVGVPCNAPPWGAIASLDFGSRGPRWEASLGTVRDLSPVPIPIPWGVPNMGGPIATAGGLVFIGAALDNYLRAFVSETGEEIWKERLPAGGHAQMRSSPGDSLVAFALAR